MKLIAFESPTGPRIGEIRGATVRDLGPIDDYYADPEAAARTTAEPDLPLSELRTVPPVPTTARIFCAGINYRCHAEEAERAGVAERSCR
ncbi:hypothetical protein [Nocardia brasiliensis]|uniref:hypothetical protein n=1 Tax=Nocardia brasiliensis TaxID=37326 RepID=UPI002454D35C|nr:hypothetical protein [Nocardia brasiliensis]